ncbi:MAG TPA: hypothetical protein VFS43_30580 [Polyangiaceae bacterium]|nr:hypothetical protein [Polyangiaceae bacterium]
MLRLIRGGLWGAPRPPVAPAPPLGPDEGAKPPAGLAMTPQLEEAVRLLQLSRAEMAAAVAAELAAKVAGQIAARRDGE